MASKLEGEGFKALVAWPLVEELFLRLPLLYELLFTHWLEEKDS